MIKVNALFRSNTNYSFVWTDFETDTIVNLKLKISELYKIYEFIYVSKSFSSNNERLSLEILTSQENIRKVRISKLLNDLK